MGGSGESSIAPMNTAKHVQPSDPPWRGPNQFFDRELSTHTENDSKSTNDQRFPLKGEEASLLFTVSSLDGDMGSIFLLAQGVVTMILAKLRANGSNPIG
jgi:hypothetical protein